MFTMILIACVFANEYDTELICETYRVEQVESCQGFVDKVREANPDVMIKQMECVPWKG